MEMPTVDQGTASERKEPTQSPTTSRKKRKTPAKKLCCCSWGPECNQIRDTVMKLPEGSEYDLWKAENAKFVPSKNAASQKFEEVIRRHLGVAGHPKEYSIAVHHWKLPLLCYRNNPSNRSRNWVKPITAQQAKDFGIETDKSDQHPSGNNMFCQSPNNPKFELKQYVSAWSSGRGYRQERRTTTAVTAAPSTARTDLPVEDKKSPALPTPKEIVFDMTPAPVPSLSDVEGPRGVETIIGEFSALSSPPYNPTAATAIVETVTDEPVIGVVVPFRRGSFPSRLHSILSGPESQEYIAWLSHGRAFRVLQPKAIEANVLSRFFKSRRYESFQRQVCQYVLDETECSRS
jgi:hypothetical protein